MAKRYHGARKEIIDMVVRLRAQLPPRILERGEVEGIEQEEETGLEEQMEMADDGSEKAEEAEEGTETAQEGGGGTDV